MFKTKIKTTVWDKFKNFINSKPRETIITRQEMLNYIYKKDRGSRNKAQRSYSSADHYKGLLISIGIMEQAGTGQYKILYHIRKNVTVSQIRKALYGNHGTWRTWFNDFKVE